MGSLTACRGGHAVRQQQGASAAQRTHGAPQAAAPLAAAGAAAPIAAQQLPVPHAAAGATGGLPPLGPPAEPQPASAVALGGDWNERLAAQAAAYAAQHAQHDAWAPAQGATASGGTGAKRGLEDASAVAQGEALTGAMEPDAKRAKDCVPP